MESDTNGGCATTVANAISHLQLPDGLAWELDSDRAAQWVHNVIHAQRRIDRFSHAYERYHRRLRAHEERVQKKRLEDEQAAASSSEVAVHPSIVATNVHHWMSTHKLDDVTTVAATSQQERRFRVPSLEEEFAKLQQLYQSKLEADHLFQSLQLDNEDGVFSATASPETDTKAPPIQGAVIERVHCGVVQASHIFLACHSPLSDSAATEEAMTIHWILLVQDNASILGTNWNSSSEEEEEDGQEANTMPMHPHEHPSLPSWIQMRPVETSEEHPEWGSTEHTWTHVCTSWRQVQDVLEDNHWTLSSSSSSVASSNPDLVARGARVTTQLEFEPCGEFSVDTTYCHDKTFALQPNPQGDPSSTRWVSSAWCSPVLLPDSFPRSLIVEQQNHERENGTDEKGWIHVDDSASHHIDILSQRVEPFRVSETSTQCLAQWCDGQLSWERPYSTSQCRRWWCLALLASRGGPAVEDEGKKDEEKSTLRVDSAFYKHSQQSENTFLNWRMNIGPCACVGCQATTTADEDKERNKEKLQSAASASGGDSSHVHCPECPFAPAEVFQPSQQPIPTPGEAIAYVESESQRVLSEESAAAVEESNNKSNTTPVQFSTTIQSRRRMRTEKGANVWWKWDWTPMREDCAWSSWCTAIRPTDSFSDAHHYVQTALWSCRGRNSATAPSSSSVSWSPPVILRWVRKYPFDLETAGSSRRHSFCQLPSFVCFRTIGSIASHTQGLKKITYVTSAHELETEDSPFSRASTTTTTRRRPEYINKLPEIAQRVFWALEFVSRYSFPDRFKRDPSAKRQCGGGRRRRRRQQQQQQQQPNRTDMENTVEEKWGPRQLLWNSMDESTRHRLQKLCCEYLAEHLLQDLGDELASMHSSNQRQYRERMIRERRELRLAKRRQRRQLHHHQEDTENGGGDVHTAADSEPLPLLESEKNDASKRQRLVVNVLPRFDSGIIMPIQFLELVGPGSKILQWNTPKSTTDVVDIDRARPAMGPRKWNCHSLECLSYPFNDRMSSLEGLFIPPRQRHERTYDVIVASTETEDTVVAQSKCIGPHCERLRNAHAALYSFPNADAAASGAGGADGSAPHPPSLESTIRQWWQRAFSSSKTVAKDDDEKKSPTFDVVHFSAQYFLRKAITDNTLSSYVWESTPCCGQHWIKAEERLGLMPDCQVDFTRSEVWGADADDASSSSRVSFLSRGRRTRNVDDTVHVVTWD